MDNGFSFQVKESLHGDEYYTPKYAVDVIVPYLKKFKKIWCPFDKENSQFVKVLVENGFDVTYGHIETGQDFFYYDSVPNGCECVVSNPPFSKRQQIIERLYKLDVPFALIMNFNGLFDSKKRWEMFKDNGVEILVPYGRMAFVSKEKGMLNSPNFQSVYVCHNVLEKQIEYAHMEKMDGERKGGDE